MPLVRSAEYSEKSGFAAECSSRPILSATSSATVTRWRPTTVPLTLLSRSRTTRSVLSANAETGRLLALAGMISNASRELLGVSPSPWTCSLKLVSSGSIRSMGFARTKVPFPCRRVMRPRSMRRSYAFMMVARESRFSVASVLSLGRRSPGCMFSRVM